MSKVTWTPLSRLDVPSLLARDEHRPVAMYEHNGEQYKLVTSGICLGWMYRLLTGEVPGAEDSVRSYRRTLQVDKKDQSSLYLVVKVHSSPSRRGFVEGLLPGYLRPYWTTLEQPISDGWEEYCLSVIEVHPDLKPVEVGLLYQTLRTSWEHRGTLVHCKTAWSPVIQRLFWATAVARGGHSPWVHDNSAARLLIAVRGLGAVMDYYKKSPRYKYSEQSSSWDWYWGRGTGPSDWSIGENVTKRMGDCVPTPPYVAVRGGYNLSRPGIQTYRSFVEREATEEHLYYEEIMVLYEELKRQQDSSPRSNKERKS